jgi:E3 ubiquitin-protein ligase TRIP12
MAKMAAASSSRTVDEDLEVTDHARGDGSSLVENMAEMGDDDDDGHGEGDRELMGDDDLNEDKDENDDEISPTGLSSGGLRGHGLSIFGDFSPFGSHMVGLSSRLKTMLNNIKMTADPTTRLLTLQELSELLSISTEDTLAGSFQVEQFVRELVRILGGRGASDDEDDDEDGEPQDEDAALAAALSLSGGDAFAGDENLEAQVLACRCLANLMEALPGVAHTVVYHGAIPVLCSKLIEISYIDLAEQTLSVSY